MSNHIVSIEDLKDFLPKTRIFSSSSKNGTKALDVVVDPTSKEVWYEFSLDGEWFSNEDTIKSAIETYNQF